VNPGSSISPDAAATLAGPESPLTTRETILRARGTTVSSGSLTLDGRPLSPPAERRSLAPRR